MDLDIAIQEKLPRRFQGRPCYHQIIPVFGGSKEAEAQRVREKETDDKRQKDQQKKAQDAQKAHQAQNQKNLNQLQQMNAQQTGHASHEDARDAKQHEKNREALQKATQGVQEHTHTQFENNPQPRPQISQRSTGTSNLLKNIQTLTQQSATQARQETAKLAKDDAREVKHFDEHHETAQKQEPLFRSTKLGYIARAAGFYENGRTALEARSDPARMKLLLNPRQAASKPFSPEKPFYQLSKQGFERLFNPDHLSEMIHQVSQHLAETHPALEHAQGKAVALFHGGLLFVKEGPRVRAFRLSAEGVLHEATQEYEGFPLSQQARAEMTRLLKQKGVHARLDGDKEPLIDPKELKEESKLSKTDRSLSSRGELRSLSKDDSSFSALLRRVLEEGESVAKKLEKGEDPYFAEKENWVAFFSNVVQLGSAFENKTRSFDEILEFIFRGLFKKPAEEGETLVSDIKYQKGSSLKKEDKFAQIGILNEDLLSQLRNLEPGEKISKELMQQFLGEELAFIQLVHVLQKNDPALASEILKNVKFDPAANVDPYSQARLEHHIFSASRKRRLEEEMLHNMNPSDALPVFANPYELQPKFYQRFIGGPRFYTLITYAGAVIGFLLLMFLIFGR